MNLLFKKHENFAKKTFHSTAEQTALIAKKSNVKLILGHFSTRYKDLTLFLKNLNLFQNVDLALENGTIFINFNACQEI